MPTLKSVGGGGVDSSQSLVSEGGRGVGGVASAGVSLLAVAKNSLFAFGSGWDKNRKSQGRFTMEQIAQDASSAGPDEGSSKTIYDSEEPSEATPTTAVGMASAYGLSLYAAAASSATALLKKQSGGDKQNDESIVSREALRKVMIIMMMMTCRVLRQ